MILVITINHDPITINICMWLLHFKKSFNIYSIEDTVRVIRVENGSMVIKNITRGYELDLKNVDKILYRQGDVISPPTTQKNQDKNLFDFITRENVTLRQFFYHKIKQINHLGHPQLADLNKLIVLEKAIQFGILVPDYLFSSKKSDLIAFKAKHSEIITKTILPAFHFDREDNRHSTFTELLNKQDLERLKSNFHPTFFQKLIPKKFDVRVFYLFNKFSTIAIISQNNSQTQIDSRHYDRVLPNRQIPLQLPKNLEKKLQNLISDLHLKYCSIDLIYGIDKQFYFLEINPIGQFGNVSYFGNYYLEKEMAKTLCA